jgi:recombination protein RecT
MATKTLTVKPLHELFAKRRADMEAVIPKHLTAERLMRIAWVLIRRTPKLMECRAETVVESVIRASVLGLELGYEAHLVPFASECVLIMDYKGFVSLSRRSGVKTVVARVVMPEDTFNVSYGTDEKIEHIPALNFDRTDPERILAVYAVATFADGVKQFDVMTKAEVDLVKAKSKARDDGPWSDRQAYPEMAKKTVVKRLCKLLPQSPELTTAVELDNRLESGEATAVTLFDDEETAAQIVKDKTKERMDELAEKFGAAEDQGEAQEADIEPVEAKAPTKPSKSGSQQQPVAARAGKQRERPQPPSRTREQPAPAPVEEPPAAEDEEAEPPYEEDELPWEE